MSVLVFGSINMDLAAYVPKLPKHGETLFGDSFLTIPGGKGANQAVAAARLGAEVQMFGRVGSDSFGRNHLAAMQIEGVKVEGIFQDTELSTGVAIIEIEESGENTIVVISGANMAVSMDDVDRCTAALSQAQVLLLQLEVPMEANISSAHEANRRGVRVVLDPAPAADLPKELFPLLDVITPNEVEVAALVGFSVETQEQAFSAADQLLVMGARAAVVKMGGQGACFVSNEERVWIDSFPVDAVDTVAAGDAFNGGLAAALSEGATLKEALRWASGAGALAVTRLGALSSLPQREELDALLSQA